MSKGVKMAIGVAAAIAIPFAAPALAGMIGASMGITAASFGMSAAVGATLGSAAVGATLGAASSAVLGQNIGRGALMGGIGGGIGGFASVPDVTSVAGSGASLPSMGGGTGLVGTPDVTFGAQSIGANLGGGTGVVAPTATTGTGLSSGYGGGTGLTLPSIGYNSPTATFATAPASTFATGTTTGAGGGTGLTLPTSTAAYTPSAGLSGTTSASLPSMGGGTGLTIPTSLASTAPTAVAGAAQPTTFMEALRAVPQTIASKFSDPKALADLTLRAAGQLAGSALSGDGLSGEERGLLDAQTAELRELQKNNVALFNERLEQARGLVGEAKYFDPEYFGLQRARRTQIAGATAKRAGLRGLEGGRRTAEGRRYDLATARDTGTAFDQGFGTGVVGRLQTQQAGLSLYPGSYPSSMGDYTNLSRAYTGAADRKQREQAQIGSLFGSLTGRIEDNTAARRA